MHARSTSLFISVFILSASVALAHKYDSTKPVTLTGKVGKIEWHKPYVKVHLEATDASGKRTDWEIETATPTVLESDGLTSTAIKVGDQITVQGDGASDGSHHALGRSMTLANGQTVAITGPEQQGGAAAQNASDSALPSTATALPLIGLLGLAALGAGTLLSIGSRLSWRRWPL